MRYGTNKRYKLVPATSGSMREYVGGPVVRAALTISVKDGDADGEEVAFEAWTYDKDTGWKQESTESTGFNIVGNLFNGNCRDCGLHTVLFTLLERPDVKMNPGDYNGVKGEFYQEADPAEEPCDVAAPRRFACVVVDAQHDFIDGSLGSQVAQNVAPMIAGFCKWARENGAGMVFTKDTHHDNYLDTHEGKTLPVEHCIEGTHGHNLFTGLYADKSEVVKKCTFMADPDLMGRALKKCLMLDRDEVSMGVVSCCTRPVFLFGYCTSICVAANALMIRMLMPNAEIYVLADLCADIDKESHAAALKVMKNNQINIINSMHVASIVGSVHSTEQASQQ